VLETPVAAPFLAVAIIAAALAAYALRRCTRLEQSLETERLQRLSSSESAKTELRLLAERIGAIEQRIGRSRRLTAAKRDRALEMLAHGASETSIARELEMRESEVAVLARLRNTVGAEQPMAKVP